MREISQIRAAGGCGGALRCGLFGHDKHHFSRNSRTQRIIEERAASFACALRPMIGMALG
jgi:hypothetical protein